MGGRKELGVREIGKTIIRTYYMKKHVFSIKEERISLQSILYFCFQGDDSCTERNAKLLLLNYF